MKILLTGGGTAGHIIPLLAVVSEVKRLSHKRKIGKLEFMLITSDANFDKSIFDAGIEVKVVMAGKLRRYFSLKNITDIFRIPVGVLQSLVHIYRFKPDVVFSKGGFASIPPVIAAWLLKTPILTHESDIVPGLANKIISFFASEILVSFEDTRKYFPTKEVVVMGNPIREDVFLGDREYARKVFDLKENLPTVLIYGGSQGAQKINNVVLESLPDILQRCQVVHICGDKNYEGVKKKIKALRLERLERYKVFPFLSGKLKDVYALCDVVISRAGANSLFEIMALEKPSIVIPLPSSANNHQLKNARFFEKRGMLFLIEEKDLTSRKLIESLFRLLQEKEVSDRMKENIRKYNDSTRRKAAVSIAEEILRFKSEKIVSF